MEELNGRRLQRHFEKETFPRLTLDADSTVKTVFGRQQGASVGYNPHKRGARSYHPLMAFLTERKCVLNSWFRPGSAYTANGIVEFLQQSAAWLPKATKIFFRADSGFFNGSLFDWLEQQEWDYLVKVKFKGLKKLLAEQHWQAITGQPWFWMCEFSHQCKDWDKARSFKAVRWIDKYEEKVFFGKVELVPIYKYACYCTNQEIDAWAAHECYKQRSTSENWIEQVKNQLLAGMTLTNNFWANDMLWQLSVLAYNLSVMVRLKEASLHRQEHSTFRDWFIRVPAEFYGSIKPKLRLYEYYLFKERWLSFTESIK